VEVPGAGKPVMQKTGMTFVPDNWRSKPGKPAADGPAAS
jgi:hypothetical protein